MNREYKFSHRSLNKINSCESQMIELCHTALEIANKRKMFCPDFGISYGLRTAGEQLELFRKGREYTDHEYFIKDRTKVVTFCDGWHKKSVHQSGMAIDFICYIDGEVTWEPEQYALVATCFFEAASDLGLNIDWGGSFKSISDGGHIEIVE